jgi:hypothetical protein
MLRFANWKSSRQKEIEKIIDNIRVSPPEGAIFSNQKWIAKDGCDLFWGDEKGIKVVFILDFDYIHQKLIVVNLGCIGVANNIFASRNKKDIKNNYFDFYKVQNEHKELFKEILNINYEPPYTAYNIAFRGYFQVIFLHEFLNILNEKNPKELDLALLTQRKIIKNRLGFSNK